LSISLYNFFQLLYSYTYLLSVGVYGKVCGIGMGYSRFELLQRHERATFVEIVVKKLEENSTITSRVESRKLYPTNLQET